MGVSLKVGGFIKNGEFHCFDYIENIQKNLGGYILKIEDPCENQIWEFLYVYIVHQGRATDGSRVAIWWLAGSF